MERFLIGLAAGAVAGGVTYAVELVRPWWFVAALAVAFVVWFGQLPGIG